MSLTSPPMNNQATVPITTANNNTLTFPSTITTRAIPSASGMVSMNTAPAIRCKF